MSMIFTLLFHEYIFGQITTNGDHVNLFNEDISKVNHKCQDYLSDAKNVRNVNYLIKGLRRLFEEDMTKQSDLFVEVYVSLYKLLETIDRIYINNCICFLCNDECFFIVDDKLLAQHYYAT